MGTCNSVTALIQPAVQMVRQDTLCKAKGTLIGICENDFTFKMQSLQKYCQVNHRRYSGTTCVHAANN